MIYNVGSNMISVTFLCCPSVTTRCCVSLVRSESSTHILL